MNRKLPRPRDYVIGTFVLLILGIPLCIAFLAIGIVYWTCRGIQAFGEPAIPERTT